VTAGARAIGPAGGATPVQAIDWDAVATELDVEGHARIERLLDPGRCAALVATYTDADAFRKRIVMDRHGYGRGEYQYFRYPLPSLIAGLRASLYAALVPAANAWMRALRRATTFPATHAEFIERCHAAGQLRPTPLLLKYGPGDYNRLHQDLYGAQVFPLQVTILLSQPGRDFTGGEFVMTESRPRMQSRPAVVPLAQGDAVVFAAAERPARSARGTHRVTMRHGVSRLLGGARYTAGIIFHDAE
jgi:hypothetical protein